MNVSAAILAGGKSSRMGQDKGLMDFNGKPMVRYALDAFSSLDIPIQIIANNKDYEQFDFPVVADEKADCGPLGGIYTALKNTTADYVLITACDTPLLTSEVLQRMLDSLEENTCSVAVQDGKLHPLCGIFPVRALKEIEEKIADNELKVIHALKRIKHVEFDDMDSSVFANVNTIEELNALK